MTPTVEERNRAIRAEREELWRQAEERRKAADEWLRFAPELHHRLTKLEELRQEAEGRPRSLAATLLQDARRPVPPPPPPDNGDFDIGPAMRPTPRAEVEPEPDYALSESRNAWAYVEKAYGPMPTWNALLPALAAVYEAQKLLRAKRERRAKGHDRHEKHLISTIGRKHGVEIVFQAALAEALPTSPRVAYLLAVGAGLLPPPKDEDALVKAEKRWGSPERRRAIAAVTKALRLPKPNATPERRATGRKVA